MSILRMNAPLMKGRQIKQQPKKQQGLSLVMVIFIIVVLSMLGTAMLRIMAVSSDSVAREILSTRALHAAESGVQVKLNQIFIGGSGCSTGLPSLGGLQGCSVSIEQCRTLEVPLGSGQNYYSIISVGRCGPATDQAVRRVEVQAKDV